MPSPIGPGPSSAAARGRPRSERARLAVLEAVDDLLVEQGYAAMTMKGIAERAGVGRQTVYRWWSTKAEILVEACLADAREELTLEPAADAHAELCAYLEALVRFLACDDAGRAYRALLGEAQHDRAVRDLLGAADVLGPTARQVLDRLRAHGVPLPEEDTGRAVAQLVGPVLYRVLDPAGEGVRADPAAEATALLRLWGAC